MDNIKQINTGVAELFAVLLPEGAHTIKVYPSHIEMEEDALLSFTAIQTNKDSKYYGKELLHGIDLPTGNWTPLGLSTELTEEQCAGLVERLWDYYKNYLAPKDGNVGNYKRLVCYTAKQAFASLMQANGINEPHLILKRLS